MPRRPVRVPGQHDLAWRNAVDLDEYHTGRGDGSGDGDWQVRHPAARADVGEQRLAAQPWLGLGGLLLTAVLFLDLVLGTGSTATALLILGPISTFALPTVAMIGLWWND